jgi:DHA2 family multidrug resistance protein-like MFS transporter
VTRTVTETKPGESNPHLDGLPLPRRYWAILSVAFVLVMSVMDSSMANVALPTIARDLNIEPSFAVWIVNAYLMAIMVTVLPFASLGDIIGYSRVYIIGMAVYGIASLATALSDSLITLLLSRILMGLGASCVMSVNMAVVRFIYPVSIIGRGIGLNAFIIAVSAAAGPTFASAVLSIADWPWLFAINVPISAAAVAIGIYALPPNFPQNKPFDYVSAVLNGVCFALLIILIETVGRNSDPYLAVLEFILMIFLFAVLYDRQVRASSPLVPFDLLRIPIFALSIGTSTCSFIAQTLALIALPFFFQTNLGFTAVQTGLLMTPWPIATGIIAPISGRLADRYPPGLLGSLGLGAFALGLIALAMLDEGASIFDITWRMALAGAGFGLYQSPNNRTMILSAPRERSGGAAGMQGMARLVGQTVGGALTAVLFSILLQESATVFAIGLGAGFAILGSVVSGLRMSRRALKDAP